MLHEQNQQNEIPVVWNVECKIQWYRIIYNFQRLGWERTGVVTTHLAEACMHRKPSSGRVNLIKQRLRLQVQLLIFFEPEECTSQPFLVGTF